MADSAAVKLSAFDTVAKALDAAHVRYLVAGGLAVNAHGYVRPTMDIDLVVALDPGNIHHAFRALARIGYRPAAPFDAVAFARPEQRDHWREEKGTLLKLHNKAYPGTSVVVVVHEPFDFGHEYDIAMRGELLPDIHVRFVSIPTLIRMKQATGHPRDLDDIEHLSWLQEHPDECAERPVDWSGTTFDGSRHEQLRQAQRMTLRQRLEALDQLTELSERLQAMPRRCDPAGK